MNLHTFAFGGGHRPAEQNREDHQGRFQRRFGPGFDLTVVAVTGLTPRMRRISLIGDDLARLDWVPGQDLVLELPLPGGERAGRHYTIRRFDPLELRIDIDLVLHGAGASGQWLAGAQPGERVRAFGPRGRTRVSPTARRHLFVGDETAIPAIFAMAETLLRGAEGLALIEIRDEAEIQPLVTPADVTVEWRSRGPVPGADSRLNFDRLLALGPDPRWTHAYVLGETGQVRAQRHALMAMGFDRAQITAEGYWRPGRIGGHDHV